MKKWTIFLLSLLIILMLTACGNQETSSDAAVKATEPMETQSFVADLPKETSIPETTQPAMTTVPTETASGFDNSWASNEFEQQIALPSFEKWEIKEYNEGSSWRIFVQDVHYDAVKEYSSMLQSYGFLQNAEEQDDYGGLAYIYEADNASGYHCKLIFEAGDRNGMGSFSLSLSKIG